YTTSDIIKISTILGRLNSHWKRVPRMYIVLRSIDHLPLLDDLITAGLSDYLFPMTERHLCNHMQTSVREEFLKAQSRVLTKSLSLELGKEGHHCIFSHEDSVPFETQAKLGAGSFGEVDRVLNLITWKEFARKRVSRSLAFRGRRKEDVKHYITEIEILKRLQHVHIVRYIGSYTDPRFLAIIMSPVAQMDLSDYLARTDPSNYKELRTFFGCLTTALQYLHMEDIRHKDIKPQNILVDRGTVLFTDFGLAFDFKGEDGSETTGKVNRRSLRYCAPEVMLQESRTRKSDIWSLGIVFLEMAVVLKGQSKRYMDEFLETHGSNYKFVHSNLAALPELITTLGHIGDESDNLILEWTETMLSEQRDSRPTASSLVETIINTSLEEEGVGFCGLCCMYGEDSLS
ncbi:kinase-like domain-containing protein, partial [Dendryphion nanum]